MWYAIANALTTGEERRLGWVAFALGRKLLPLGNFYADAPISAFAEATIFHSDENSAHESEARLDAAQVLADERIRRSGLGETILFRYNSKTQFRHDAPVAQLDRVLGYEPRGWEFDSLRAHHPTCQRRSPILS
jgi:hypothetical protein